MTQSFETYKGLTRLSETATEEAGEKISDNFTEIADRVGPYYSGTGTPDADDDQAGSGGNGSFYAFSWWLKTDTDQVWVCADSAPNAAVWVEIAAASTFLALTDVDPSSYSGQALKLVRVNGAETALEFTDPGGSTDQKVGVDSLATAGYLGVAYNDGVLRTDATIGWTDGDDYVTLAVAGLQSVTSDPGSPSTGGLWYRSDLDEPRVKTTLTHPLAVPLTTQGASALWVKMGVKSVGASQSSVTITFTADEISALPGMFLAAMSIVFCCTPDWATSWRITSIDHTAVTVTFGTPTGSAGGTLYWMAMGREL